MMLIEEMEPGNTVFLGKGVYNYRRLGQILGGLGSKRSYQGTIQDMGLLEILRL